MNRTQRTLIMSYSMT